MSSIAVRVDQDHCDLNASPFFVSKEMRGLGLGLLVCLMICSIRRCQVSDLMFSSNAGVSRMLPIEQVGWSSLLRGIVVEGFLAEMKLVLHAICPCRASGAVEPQISLSNKKLLP